MKTKISIVMLVMGLIFLSGCANVSTNDPSYQADNGGIKSLDDLKSPQVESVETQVAQPIISDDEIVKKLVENTSTAPMKPLDTPTSNPVLLNKTKPMEFDASKHYSAVLNTSQGSILIAFNYGQTPNTVKNFVDLARKGFYTNTIFHRVIKGFMIQGGDPKGDGTGGPGYEFKDEPFKGEYVRGAVAMANAGPNTNGSQFFIMHADYPLQKNYTIFGMVEKGMDVVDRIANSEVKGSYSGENSTPVIPTIVESVDILEK